MKGPGRSWNKSGADISRRGALFGGAASLAVMGVGGCKSTIPDIPVSHAKGSATVSRFGILDDSQDVMLVKLARPGDISIEVSELGATVKAIRLGPTQPSMVLGYETFEEYATDPRYMCCLIGRVANRIANGSFRLDGKTYEVSRNRDGDCLHGGFSGFNKKLWTIEAVSEAPYPSVTMGFTSPHLDEGFPGQLSCSVRFSLPEQNTVKIEILAETDRPTPVNMTHHFYFNLGPELEEDILRHQLMIAGSRYTPITPGAIPTGEIAPVEATPLDLRSGRLIADIIRTDHPQIQAGHGINHNWEIDSDVPFALLLKSEKAGRRLTVRTNQPGLQINSGHRLSGPFKKYSGLVVEPQNFPDSVNQPMFPNSVLRPGENYYST
ncbi:MAG: aldose epimerase family protein, partial [Pseudomonadales bacterium]